jgi:hypothetical protein
MKTLGLGYIIAVGFFALGWLAAAVFARLKPEEDLMVTLQRVAKRDHVRFTIEPQ